MSRIAVIGAGASGLVAAYFAAVNGNEVHIFEKNEKCGKKIYLTGKGRCNITHKCTACEFLENVVTNSKFLTSSVYSFSPDDAISFFENGGLRTKTERGARIFPVSDKSSDVIRCLETYCNKAGAKFHFNENVQNISFLNGTISGIITQKGYFDCAKVIVCTGGLSYPSTGSTGDGYKFAKSAGHKIVDCVPALCGLNVKATFCKELQGLTLKNVSLIASYQGKAIRSLFGEMLFTHYGISGPIVLTISSLINRLDLSKVELILDLKPALSFEQLDKRLLKDFEANSNKTLFNCLKLLVPVSLIKILLSRSGLDSTKKVNSVTVEERRRLLTAVKNFVIKINSLRGFDEAIITSGGVDVKDINPKTMESKLIKGLYFCGEVLDLDAFTGGYNLQIAFSTGFAAGNNIRD